MKAPVLILFFVLVLVDGTALATSRIIESSPQLITFPCVSASDYLRLLKLTVDQALNSTEVAKEVEAGCLE